MCTRLQRLHDAGAALRKDTHTSKDDAPKAMNLEAFAKITADSFTANKRRRLETRAEKKRLRRLIEGDKPVGSDKEKVRVLIEAIRLHTNSDIEMDSTMDAQTLFQSAVKCLSQERAEQSSKETTFVGESLKLVENLNKLLESR